MYLSNNMQLQGGKYKICKFLGQGGFGITYLAIQSCLERYVAIKEFFIKELCSRDNSTSYVTLGTESCKETVDRFRGKFIKEARKIAKLNHPNIIRIIDVFEENGTAYYVMEYCGGGSLAEKIKKQGYFSEPVATGYILQIADALNYIHNKKMNHFDIKPSNIMLNEKDEAILIDFGLSKEYDVITGNQTSTTPVGISEGYAPMEQYMQGGVGTFSPETDIYSLGATFFKLLTGITPPNASFVNNEGVPVEELKRKGISHNAINVILSSMQARKKDRMKDISLFVEGLKGNIEYSYTNVFSETENEDTIITSSQSEEQNITDTYEKSDSIQVVDNESDFSKPDRKTITYIAVLSLVFGFIYILMVSSFGKTDNEKKPYSTSLSKNYSFLDKPIDSAQMSNKRSSEVLSNMVHPENSKHETKLQELNDDVCGIYVVTSNMFVREGPGTEFEPLYSEHCDFKSNKVNGGVVFKGSKIRVLEEKNGFVHAIQLTPNNDRDKWGNGWISKKYLKKVDNE